MKKSLLFLFALLVLQGVAQAEPVSGTVMSIANNKITLLRSDNQQQVIVLIKDDAALNSIQTGSQVTLDANRRFFGGWSADTVSAGTGSSEAGVMDAAGQSATGLSTTTDSDMPTSAITGNSTMNTNSGAMTTTELSPSNDGSVTPSELTANRSMNTIDSGAAPINSTPAGLPVDASTGTSGSMTDSESPMATDSTSTSTNTSAGAATTY